LGSEAARSGEPRGLLEGVQVIDLTHYLSGPYCTKLLATLGAEVVKIERPGSGDPARRIGPFAKGMPHPHRGSTGSPRAGALPLTLSQSKGRPELGEGPDAGIRAETGAWFLYLNTSKKGVTLNLKTEAGRDILRRLVRSANVVVESFAPGTLDKLGLGYEDLRQENPAMVMTSISNYGQTGPYRDWKAAEINLYAASGLMNITGEPDLEPLKEGAPLAQLGAGQNAFVATMAALLYAEETGQGQHIDVSIAEYGTNILENALMQYSYSGQEFTRVGNRGYGRAAWGIYPCRDGYVGIIAGPDHRWPELAKIMEREELADPRFASRYGRLVHADEVDALMLPWLLDHDKVEIFKAGQERGLGFAFVATMQDILEMEQLIARDYFVELDHPVAGPLRYPGAPIRLPDDTNGWVYRPAPLLGEHTGEVLRQRLGYSDGEIAQLMADGVV
jgi:crotonobetainyl-CoA:carnitine CoA-transferase CaiB-like acyl-CoA transferase